MWRANLANPFLESGREIAKRHIYSLEQAVVYENPFKDPTEEMLFDIWKGSIG